MLITMTVSVALAALALAMSVGYYFGRRAGSSPSTWKKRTSRVALGRRAVNLVVLIAARRLQRRFAEVELFGPENRCARELLRGSVTRMRSYRARQVGERDNVVASGQTRVRHRCVVRSRRRDRATPITPGRNGFRHRSRRERLAEVFADIERGSHAVVDIASARRLARTPSSSASASSVASTS